MSNARLDPPMTVDGVTYFRAEVCGGNFNEPIHIWRVWVNDERPSRGRYASTVRYRCNPKKQRDFVPESVFQALLAAARADAVMKREWEDNFIAAIDEVIADV